jgi:hypothetical protein
LVGSTWNFKNVGNTGFAGVAASTVTANTKLVTNAIESRPAGSLDIVAANSLYFEASGGSLSLVASTIVLSDVLEWSTPLVLTGSRANPEQALKNLIDALTSKGIATTFVVEASCSFPLTIEMSVHRHKT